MAEEKTIQSVINDLKTSRNNIATAIGNKGVTVPSGTKLSGLASLVDSIERPELQSKTVTPTTSNQTINPDNGYNGLSQVTVNAIPNQKTEDDVTASGATVTVPAGYYASKVDKSVQTAERANTTARVYVDGDGDLAIEASNDQAEGYVSAANKTVTRYVYLSANGATVTAECDNVSISKSVKTAIQATPYFNVQATDDGEECEIFITAIADQAEGYVKSGTTFRGIAVPLTIDGNKVTMRCGDAVITKVVGASIATCTVNIKWSVTARYALITATTFANGAISRFVSKTGSGTVTIPNVVCGSVITVYTGAITSVYGWSYGKEYSWDNFTHALTVPTSTGTYTAEIGELDD